MAGEKIRITVSVARLGNRYDKSIEDGYNPNTLNSFVQINFENPQSFDKIEKYYIIVKKLISILNVADNVYFDTYLSQKQPDGKLYKTASCRMFDHYDNYSDSNVYRVFQLGEVIEYLPKLLAMIEKGESDQLICLLPDSNKSKGRISITNVQDLCTALEIAYDRQSGKRERTKELEELKESIKKTVKEFKKNHPNMDPNTQTTISSAFQHLDITLKEKIMTLYLENKETIDFVAKKHALPPLSEQAIASFVKVRNNKTHSGTFEWGNCAECYLPLFALAYAALFKDLGMSDDCVNSIINRKF